MYKKSKENQELIMSYLLLSGIIIGLLSIIIDNVRDYLFFNF